MNKKLATKMAVISHHFQEAGVSLPIAEERTGIKSVRCAGSKGVTVHGRAVWGVTPREYWKFCKAQTKQFEPCKNDKGTTTGESNTIGSASTLKNS